LAVNFVLASIAGPLVGGVVVTQFSWRWLFGANVLLALLALWQLRRMTRSHPPPPLPDTSADAGLDIAGLLLFTAACTASLAWTSLGGHRFAWWSTASLVLVLATAGLWLAVLIVERRARRPFLPVELFRMREIRATAGTVIAMSGGLFALVFLMPLYLQLGQGVHASQAAVLLMPLMIGIVSGSMLTGRWLARRQVAGVLPKYGLGLAALAMAAQAALEPGLHGTALLCGLAGCGLGTVMPNAQILVQMLAGPARLAVAAAAVSLARAVGAAIGTALFSALFFSLLYGAGMTSVAGGAVDMPTPTHVLHAGPFAFGTLALWFALGFLMACRVAPVPLRATEQMAVQEVA
jgi:MFS family permease